MREAASGRAAKTKAKGMAEDDGAEAAASLAAAAAASGGGHQDKMFFTTSDLINRMNTAINESNANLPNAKPNDPVEGGGGFELQRKMPDGSYRRADEAEMASVDFQAKMKQASEVISALSPQQRIEWARYQRQQGNVLFGKGEYKEAMDVYLTCLVAMDQGTTSSSADSKNDGQVEDNTVEAESNEAEVLRLQIEQEIKLPVLLNLALGSMKLGMLSKAEKFCNFAMEMESGGKSTKAHYRRGKIRTLMGHYVSAELDLDRALELNAIALSEVPNVDEDTMKELECEKTVILREKQKLSRLINQAEKNRRQQKRAMETLFKSDESNGKQDQLARANISEVPTLYPEKKNLEQTHQSKQADNYPGDKDRPSFIQWYMQMVGRCAQKLLDVIGHDGEEDHRPVDVPVDQDLLNHLMEGKKNA